MSRCSPLSILIDECLSPELADLAKSRGFNAIAVSRLIRLRGRGDHRIAAYAIEHDMTLVTNNIVDFERIYIEHEAHPGIVFFDCSSKLRTVYWQKQMMEDLLADLQDEEPIQEAVYVTARQPSQGVVEISIEREYLPDLEARLAQD